MFDWWEHKTQNVASTIRIGICSCLRYFWAERRMYGIKMFVLFLWSSGMVELLRFSYNIVSVKEKNLAQNGTSLEEIYWNVVQIYICIFF